jgi:hypothetical protein
MLIAMSSTAVSSAINVISMSSFRTSSDCILDNTADIEVSATTQKKKKKTCLLNIPIAF